MGIDQFRFDAKRALVVGGATGMGAAAARLLVELGAEVVVMDCAAIELDGVTPIETDLGERDRIDAAVERCGGPIDVLLACAGVADGTPGIERVNFIGHRHLIETVVDAGWMPPGSAIGMISSAAGLGWEVQLDGLGEYLDTKSFEDAVAWIAAHPDKATYSWSKQAMCAYVARRAFAFAQRGIRINAIQPGPTDTPLAQANAEMWLGFGRDYREAIGVPPSSPEQQAYPLVFLCSAAASHISGISLLIDAGYLMSGLVATFDAPAARHMLAR